MPYGGHVAGHCDYDGVLAGLPPTSVKSSVRCHSRLFDSAWPRLTLTMWQPFPAKSLFVCQNLASFSLSTYIAGSVCRPSIAYPCQSLSEGYLDPRWRETLNKGWASSSYIPQRARACASPQPGAPRTTSITMAADWPEQQGLCQPLTSGIVT